jgi:hypothetical protein
VTAPFGRTVAPKWARLDLVTLVADPGQTIRVEPFDAIEISLDDRLGNA